MFGVEFFKSKNIAEFLHNRILNLVIPCLYSHYSKYTYIYIESQWFSIYSQITIAIAPNSPGSASTTTATSPTAATNANSSSVRAHINGGRFDFEDGGTYCGGWDEGMKKHLTYIKRIYQMSS